MHVDLVAGDGLALALDLVRNFDVERLVEGEGQGQNGEQSGEEAHGDGNSRSRVAWIEENVVQSRKLLGG